MRRHRQLVAASIGGSLVAGSWLALRHPATQRMDVRLGDAIRRSGAPPFERLDQAVTRTTDLGSMHAVVGMAWVLAATGRSRAATDVAAVGTLAWLTAQASKTRVRRQRPYEADGVRRLIAPPTGSSYPSGHAAVWAAVTSVVAGHARPAVAPLVRAVGAYVPLSRVYVGVHYPTDVIGGAGLGVVLGWAWLELRAALELRPGRRSRPRRSPDAPASGPGDRSTPTGRPATPLRRRPRG